MSGKLPGLMPADELRKRWQSSIRAQGDPAPEGRSRPRAAELARAVFDAIARHDAAALEELTHEEAVLEMAMAQGNKVHGKAAVMQVMHEAWHRLHSLTITELHDLSDDTAIVDGRSQYQTEEGWLVDSQIVWLCQYQGGRLVRQWLFPTVAEAKAAYSKRTAAPRAR